MSEYKYNPKSFLSKSCEACGTVFSFHKSRKNTARFCSMKCKAVAQKGAPAWNKDLTQDQYIRKEVVLENKCLNCGKPVKNKYCSQRCQRIYQNKQMKGKTYVDLYGEEKALEIRGKTSKSISKVAKETYFTRIGGSVVGKSRKGKTHKEIYGDESERIRGDIKDSIAEYYESPRGLEVRKQASDRGIELALSGKEFVNSKKGKYKGIYFGSSLEETFLKEMFRILGTLENVRRNNSKVVPKGIGFRKTAPDYLIMKDETILAYIEVKSVHLLRKDSVYEKAEALYVYGKERIILTGYFTQETLKRFEKLQGNPDPRRLNLLLSYMEEELYNYVVSRKEQRLDVEDKETNKTSRNIELGNSILNDSLPNELEDDIVRYPMKVGGRK